MNWIILSSLAGLASNGFNIVNRTALREKGDSSAYAWWFEVLRASFFSIVAFLFLAQSITSQMYIPLTILSITELISVYFFMKMHSLNQLSISSVISRMRVIWTPLFSWLILGEVLSSLQYVGIFLIFCGVVMVSSPKKLIADKAVKVAMIFSITSAVLSVVMKYSKLYAPTETVVASQGYLAIFILPFLMKNGFIRIKESAKNSLKHTLVGATFNIISSYLFVEALGLIEASKAVGLYQAMTIFSVLYGIFILKEKDNIIRKLSGAVVVIIGVILTIN